MTNPYESPNIDSTYDLGVSTAASEAWRFNAACAGHSDIFLPRTRIKANGDVTYEHRQNAQALAIAICGTCPVFDDCEAWVTANPQPVGIYAGKSARSRGGSHLVGGSVKSMRKKCLECGCNTFRIDAICTACRTAA